jgi:hypothetical protein
MPNSPGSAEDRAGADEKNTASAAFRERLTLTRLTRTVKFLLQ